MQKLCVSCLHQMGCLIVHQYNLCIYSELSLHHPNQNKDLQVFDTQQSPMSCIGVNIAVRIVLSQTCIQTIWKCSKF